MTDLPETNEILKTGLGTDKPYLGSPSVVAGIVREYLSDLTTLRTEQVQRGTSPLEGIDGLAQHLQRVFFGQDDTYLAYAWNRETSLGQALVRDGDIGGEASDAVYRLGLRLAKEYLSDLIAYENDTMDAESFNASIDGLVERYTLILSGAGTAGDGNV